MKTPQAKKKKQNTNLTNSKLKGLYTQETKKITQTKTTKGGY